MAISQMDIIRQLELIIVHPAFKKGQHRRTRNQTGFLIHIVNQVLAGNADRLSNASIAFSLFGRLAASYNHKNDPIVDFHAGILRRSLVRYYRTAGKNDPITIELPDGTYVPVFKERAPLPPELDTGAD
jgi:hypothetical protein